MVADSPVQQPLQLREHLAVLRARTWTLIATVAITVFAAMFVSLLMTPEYSSTAKVLVKPALTQQDPLQPVSLNTLSLGTERQIVQSTSVADLAGRQMDTAQSSQGLIHHVSVVVPSDTQILEITYTDPRPLIAQQGAQAFADSYITFKRDQALATYSSFVSSTQHQIDGLQTQLKR